MRDLLDDALAWALRLALAVLVALMGVLLGLGAGMAPDRSERPYKGPERRRADHNRGGSDLD